MEDNRHLLIIQVAALVAATYAFLLSKHAYLIV